MHISSQESRPTRNKRAPQRLNDYISFLANASKVTVEQIEHMDTDDIDTLFADDAPASFEDIVNWSDSEEWYQATNAENNSIAQHEVFEIVDKLPEGRTALKAKYIYKVKFDANKTIKRKARLVIKGYSQIKGIDFNKVYAPVVSKSSLRLLLSTAAVHDFDIHQLDIKTAFLNGTLEENIYMYSIPGMPYPPGTLLKLNKALYGLKQAPRVFNQELDRFIETHGFRRSVIDKGVYIKETDCSTIYLAVYVDDILIIGNDKNFITEFKAELNERFKIDDLGEAKLILGIEIIRDRAKRLIHVNQERYINNLAKKYRAKEVVDKYKVPMFKQSYNSVFEPNDGAVRIFENNSLYRSLLGAILYLNVCTRPDISFAVSVLASFCTSPRQMHWNALLDLLNYVKNTKATSITYGKVTTESRDKLEIYADADFAAKANKRKSRTGFVIYFNGGAIIWKSCLQRIVSDSTSEAELYAMFEATRYGFQVKELLKELNMPQQQIKCYEDNSGCVDWIVTQRHSSTMRAIETKYYRLQQECDSAIFEIVKIPTTKQKADIMTKQMDYSVFRTQFRMLYNIS
jgi:hypothetical protein